MNEQLLREPMRGEPPPVQSPPSRRTGFTRRLVGLPQHEAHFSVRGFKAATAQAQRVLENAGIAFIRGYNCALEVSDPRALNSAASVVERIHRGLFLEGAAMGLGIRDAMPWHLLSVARLPVFLETVRTDHPYLPTVGAGWAMARLSWRRSAILGSLDTLLVPLAFDGWGFHDCYFGRSEVVRGPSRSVVRMAGVAGVRSWYQGAGRALWFISGGSTSKAADLIEGAPPDRHPDLYAGLGLALAYAGGIEPTAVKEIISIAHRHRRHLAQGAAFALEAHVRASTCDPERRAIAAALTGRDTYSVVSLVRRTMPMPLGSCSGASPQSWACYEQWRARVAEELEKPAEKPL